MKVKVKIIFNKKRFTVSGFFSRWVPMPNPDSQIKHFDINDSAKFLCAKTYLQITHASYDLLIANIICFPDN